jgi:hypothetical protein
MFPLFNILKMTLCLAVLRANTMEDIFTGTKGHVEGGYILEDEGIRALFCVCKVLTVLSFLRRELLTQQLQWARLHEFTPESDTTLAGFISLIEHCVIF